MKIAALLDDLLFSSKISAVARELGASVAVYRTPESIPTDVEIILVDLETPGLDTVSAIQTLKATRSTKIVAYASHVQVELKQRAEAAGADSVLARSAFVQRLPELLKDCRRGL